MAAARRSLARRIARAVGLALLVVCALSLSLLRCDLSREELVAKYGQAPSRFVELEGMQVHYRDEGHGPPLLLVHGTASSLHTWDGWAQRLSSHRRVVRLDLPGFGLTGPAPDRDYSVARLARVSVALMDSLGIARFDLAGNSLGGRVALTIALDRPERVRRLVLLDAAGLSGHRPAHVFRLARTPFVRTFLTSMTPRFFIRRNVEQVYGDPSRVTDALVDRYYELTRRAGNRKAFVDRMNGPPDPELDARLPEVRAPVLVEWGELDRWIPLPFAERFRAGIPGARLVQYPGAGHVPMEELPEATSRDADLFLGAGE